MHSTETDDIEDADTFEDGQEQPVSERSSKVSASLTLVVFMASLLMVRWVMPSLVEELHYSIERGKQRARHDWAESKLSANPLAGFSNASELVAQKIAASVVHIDTTRGNLEPSEFATEELIRGQGSGVVVTGDGQILTNFHVIKSAERIQVTLSDHRRRAAHVIGVDPARDLALLQLDGAEDLIPAEWADSKQVVNGSMVWAAGSPAGYSNSTTFGIVSAI